MKTSKFLRIFALFFAFLFPKLAFPFWPLIGSGLALTGFGSYVSSKAAKAKEMLSNVDDVIFLVQLFLIAVSLLVLFLFFIWLVKFVQKKRSKRKFRDAVSLLAALKSDVVLLNEGAAFSSNELGKRNQTKNDAISALIKMLQNKFFGKKLDAQSRKQAIESLEMIRMESINSENQLILLDLWLQKFALAV